MLDYVSITTYLPYTLYRRYEDKCIAMKEYGVFKRKRPTRKRNILLDLIKHKKIAGIKPNFGKFLYIYTTIIFTFSATPPSTASIARSFRLTTSMCTVIPV